MNVPIYEMRPRDTNREGRCLQLLPATMELNPHLHYELIAHTGLYYSRQESAPAEGVPIIHIPVIVAPAGQAHIDISLRIAPDSYSVTLARGAGASHLPN